ncbi:MAG TPA: hypothetical protein VL371_15810 [Gemmataceae bacterium]|jgi:hypothetical protein|nr:hypothetical protein [Gemmataceae bacterium]
MTDTPEALAERIERVIWLADDEDAIEAHQDLRALLARLAQAEKTLAACRESAGAIAANNLDLRADRDRWREKYKAATQIRR